MTEFNAGPKTEAEALADAMVEITKALSIVLVRGAGVQPHSVADTLRDVTGRLRKRAGSPDTSDPVHLVLHRLADGIDETFPMIRRLPPGR